jgi:hypothetical protein
MWLYSWLSDFVKEKKQAKGMGAPAAISPALSPTPKREDSETATVTMVESQRNEGLNLTVGT